MRNKGKQYQCKWCGMRHQFRTCHVHARGGALPDEADRLAQELFPDPGIVKTTDARWRVAKLLRRLGQ